MKLIRYDSLQDFHCLRCGRTKRSKLMAIYAEKPNLKICNACYGNILSIYNVKAGTSSDDEKAEKIANLLSQLVDNDQRRTQERLFRASEQRAEFLDQKTIVFVTTSECLAEKITTEESSLIDWSPLIIGLCKAFENQLLNQLIIPYKKYIEDHDLSSDFADKDVSRFAKYLKSSDKAPPEMGSFSYFLKTATHSKERSQSSPTIKSFLTFIRKKHDCEWLISENGLQMHIDTLVTQFRNKSAHVGQMSRDEYLKCREFVIGNDGIMWILVASLICQK